MYYDGLLRMVDEHSRAQSNRFSMLPKRLLRFLTRANIARATCC